MSSLQTLHPRVGVPGSVRELREPCVAPQSVVARSRRRRGNPREWRCIPNNEALRAIISLDCRASLATTAGVKSRTLLHLLFLDGVYVTTGERLSFRRVPPPSEPALETLVRGSSEWVGRTLERQGLVVRDLGAQLSDGGLA